MKPTIELNETNFDREVLQAALPVLVGLGITELSANAPAIPAVKQAVRETDSESARELADQALELSSAAEVRQLVAGENAVRLRSPAS